MQERLGGRAVFFLALAAEHRDEAARLAAKFVDTAEKAAGKPVPRPVDADGKPMQGVPTPAEFLYAFAERGGGPQYDGAAKACAKHGVTWDEVDTALAVLRRLVRL